MGMLLRRHYKQTKGAAEKPVAPKVEKKVVEKKAKTEITAEEIKAMNGTKLRKFAKENGIESPEDLTVGELKAILCEKFG